MNKIQPYDMFGIRKVTVCFQPERHAFARKGREHGFLLLAGYSSW